MKFIKNRFNLTATELKNIHPKKAAALLGEWCHQPIKNTHQQIKQHFKDPLLTLLQTPKYRSGRLRGKDYDYPATNIDEQTPDYISGYEEGYTIKLLNSNETFWQKGFKLGLLAACLNKQSLEEMEFIEYSSCNSQIRDNPGFISAFKQGLEDKKIKTSLSLNSDSSTMNNHSKNSSSTTFPGQNHFLQESPATLVQRPFPTNPALPNHNSTMGNFSSLETSSIPYPAPQLNHQEREENSLNRPAFTASEITPDKNTSTVVTTQSPLTRPYSINNSIPWEKSSLNSANANKTRSGQTRAAFVAENPCHFFQNP
ncbi:hypothetical protein, partial [Legionella fairfieldensis]|uniref:hypothetical protein n=2 Tax=Legionella fairfieldensis TaxID=45064 RepID=UPI00146FC75E